MLVEKIGENNRRKKRYRTHMAPLNSTAPFLHLQIMTRRTVDGPLGRVEQSCINRLWQSVANDPGQTAPGGFDRICLMGRVMTTTPGLLGFFIVIDEQDEQQLSVANLRAFDYEGATCAQFGVSLEQEFLLFIQLQI